MTDLIEPIKIKNNKPRFTVLQDTREQLGWHFEENEYCNGMNLATLKTGDYTIEGFEKHLCIERKGSIAEFSNNITDKRFERELERMREFTHSFLILEFDMYDIYQFPLGSSIPKWTWPKLKVTSKFIEKKLIEYELTYPTKIVLVGRSGKEFVSNIFRKIFNDKEKK